MHPTSRLWLPLWLLALVLAALLPGCGDRPSDYIGEDEAEDTEETPSTGSAATCSIASVEGTSGDITVNFSTDDPDGDTVTVFIQFSTDTGATYTTCTDAASNTFPNGSGGLSTSDSHVYVWDSAVDVGTDAITVRIRVTVADPFNAAGTCESQDLELNGSGVSDVPACAITSPAAGAALKATIPVTYTLTDSDDTTTADILAEFSTDGGTTYATAALAAGAAEDITGLTTSITGAIHTFEWDSLTDVPDQDATPETSVRIRITPSDTDGTGTGCESEVFTVDGSAPDNTAPTCTLVNPAGGETLGEEVTINYTLADAEQTTDGSISVSYSTDGGSTFDPATELTGGPSEGTTGLDLSAAGTSHVFVWDAGTDVLGTATPPVTMTRVRIQPSDGALQGAPCESPDFTLDTPRTVTGITVMSADGSVTYNDIPCCSGSSPLVLLDTVDSAQLLVEAAFTQAPTTEDVTDTPTSGTIEYQILDPTVATVDGAGLVSASATGANACTTLSVTFTPDGVNAVGAAQVQDLLCCVDLGGSNDSDQDPTTNAMRLGPDGAAGTADDALAIGDIDADLPGTASGAPVGAGGSFEIVLTVNTGNDTLGAYALEVLFDETVIQIDETQGVSGVSTSTTFPELTLAAVNPENGSGRLRFNGWQVSGNPTGIFDLATTYWSAVATGTTGFAVHLCNLVTPAPADIGPPTSCTDPLQPPGEGRQAIAGSGQFTVQ